MDDQRQPGFARRRDMGAEHLLLHLARAVVVVEIEPGLADADDPRVRRQCGQLGRGGRRVVGRLVRMRADRAPDIVIGFGDRPHRRELVEPGADRQHRADAGGARPGDHRIALGGEIREIEMAMAVDEHRRAAAASAGEAGFGLDEAREDAVRRRQRPARRQTPRRDRQSGAHRQAPPAGRAARRRAPGTKGCVRIARWRRTSANAYNTVAILAGSLRRKAQGACSST